MDEGAEVVIPGLLDFCLYCLYNFHLDYRLYGMGRHTRLLYQTVYRYLLGKERDMIDAIAAHGRFARPPCLPTPSPWCRGTSAWA